MSDWKAGDLVEATKGETVMRGKLWNDCSGAVMVGATGHPVDRLLASGFTLKPIEPAPEPLPTEAGWYLTGTKEAVYLAADGYWTVPHAFGVTGEDMAKYAPFTRLRPEAEIAAEVIEVVRAEGWAQHGKGWDVRLLSKQLDNIAACFGVTS